MHFYQAMGLAPITCSVKAAVAATGLGKDTIYSMMNDGRLESATVGGRRLVFVDSLQNYLEACRVTREEQHEQVRLNTYAAGADSNSKCKDPLILRRMAAAPHSSPHDNRRLTSLGNVCARTKFYAAHQGVDLADGLCLSFHGQDKVDPHHHRRP